MTEEIKEILDDLGNKDNYIEEFGYQYKRISLYDSFQLLDYITNLQQDLEKANGIIEKDRQFYKCRMDEYAELKKENESNINRIHELEQEIDSEYVQKENYKSRCKKAIEYIDEHTLFVNGGIIKSILKGSDENE